MQDLDYSSMGYSSTCALVAHVLPCVSWHNRNPARKGFHAALQMKIEPTFYLFFDEKVKVKIHEAALHMNENDELWMLIKCQLDFF